MAVRRMEHVGVVVADLASAVAYFIELGLELEGEAPVEGGWVDRVVGLDGVRADIAVMRTPDGLSRLELATFRSPRSADVAGTEPANVPGIRHLLFVVDDIADTVQRLGSHGGELIGSVEQYEQSYRLCYLRGPAGIIVELAEELG
jgi:catechol 2,3-dioxygenase-like lactoylglutathione lyase family enzyme